MKTQRQKILLTILAIGCATLIVPVFTPPQPLCPTVFGFAPYAVLLASSFLIRSRSEELAVLIVSLFVLLTGYCYLDSIYFNRVFSWQVVGRVQDFLPAFQFAFAGPLATVLFLRRLRFRHTRHAA